MQPQLIQSKDNPRLRHVRGHLAGLPFTVRLVLCMWLTDTELAAKLIRVAYSKA